MPSGRQHKKPQRYSQEDSEVETESEAESVSDYQATSNSDEDRCSTPDSQKDAQCGVCKRNVNSSDKSLQCDTCSEWCHIKCGGVTKEHYRQMVALDESNIELTWECPPCHKKSHPEPEPDLEPPQQTVAKLPKPTPTPSEAISAPVTPPVTPKTPVTPIMPVNHKPAQRPIAPAPVLNRTPPVAITMPQNHRLTPTNGVNKQTNGVHSFPDVRIRDLPFYPVKATLLRPCSLTAKSKDSLDTQNQNLAFYLTQEQANIVNNGRKVESNGMVVYKMHILLRFTKASPDGIQDDDFPKNIVLKVNNKVCPLPNPKPVPANRPNMEAKRPPKPLIITSLCKLNTKSCLNQVSVTWVPRKDDSAYTMSIYLVEKLTPEDLLKKLKLKGQRDPQVTKNVISSKLEDRDDEISTSSVKVSMADPLSMTRMTFPCRASTCDHLQCFDADMYIRMNEKKPKWVCPVCNKPAYYEHLFLDGFYIQLLLSPKFKALTTNEIILNNDASWEAVEETALGVSDSDDDYSEPPPKKALTNSKVSVDDDDDISVIPIAEMVDKDGAPILTDTAIPSNIPVNTFLASNMSSGNSSSNSVTISNNSVNNSLSKQVSLDDDLDPKRAFPQELDYMDWNYSVKFFQFLRDPPPDYRKSPTPPPPSPKEDSKSIQSSEVSDSGSSSIKIADKFAYNKRGRGRGGRGGRGRGGSRNNKNDTEDDEDEIPAKPVNGGRGRARGRGRGGRAKTNVSNSKRRRVAESSEEESETEESEEEEVTKPPPPSRSGRSARNTKRVNYAAIEDSFEVLDTLM